MPAPCLLGWAHLGECAKNPDFTSRKCPVSCGVCKPKCKDTEASCSGWAAAGECESNPSFMYKTCPAACDVCASHPGDCGDVSNTTDCKVWAERGECIESAPRPDVLRAHSRPRAIRAAPLLASHARPGAQPAARHPIFVPADPNFMARECSG